MRQVMRQKNSKWAIGGRGFVAIAVAGVVGTLGIITAGTARANNEFQNAFEDQLGRIAAYQAVAFGARVLSGAYYPVAVPVPYYAPAVVYAPPVVYAPSYGNYYGRPHKLKLRQVVYYQERPCNRDYDHAPRYYRGGGHPSHGHGHRHGRDSD